MTIDCAYYVRGERQEPAPRTVAEAAAIPRHGGSFVWIDALQLGELRPRVFQIAALGSIPDREEPDVRLGQAGGTGDRRPAGLGTVRRPVGERPLEQSAELDERSVALFDPEVDDSLPRLALRRDHHDRRAAAPAPVAALRFGCVERVHQAQCEGTRGRVERLAHRLPHPRRRDHVRLADPALTAG